MSALGEKLRRLEDLWTDCGMPPSRLWAPGLPVDQIRQMLAEVVPEVLDELVDWYSWHDGWDPDLLVGPTMAPSIFDPYSLTDSLEVRRALMVAAVKLASNDPEPAEFWWPPSWLPIGTDDGGGYLVVNLADLQGIPAGAVLAVDWENILGFRDPVAPSMAEMIDVWLQLLPYGWWTWDCQTGDWRSEYDQRDPAVPEHLRRPGIVG